MAPHGRHANVRSHRRGGPRRRLTVAPWIVIASVSTLVLSGMTGGYVYLANSGCSGDPVRAEILADPSVKSILDKLAREWQETEPTITDAKGEERCVEVEVLAKDSADVALALGNEWDARLTGPAPDVWIPASTAWVREASADADAERILPELQPSLARTPTVIAMPEPMVKALSATVWKDHKPTWETLIAALGSGASWESYGKPEWGALKVGMTDPAKSTAGLHALMAVTDANDDGEVDSKERQTVWNFKQAVSKSDMYKESTEQLFAGLAKADAQSAEAALKYVSGFPALERDIINYNATKPKVPLVAVYPEGGSADADIPLLVLNASWTTKDRQAVAKNFLTYLRGDHGRAAFQAEGYRDPNRIGGANLASATGIQPQVQTLPRAVLLPDSVKVTRKTWQALARPVNLLLVMDVTGSMNEVVPGTGGRTKLDLAKEAATNAVGMFGTQAHVGLWAFSTPTPGGPDYRPVAPIKTLDPEHRDNLVGQINGLAAVGNTALFNTTWAAHQEVQGHYLDGAANVVVVITDGSEETVAGGLSLDALVTKLKDSNGKEDGKKKVQVVTIGYGPNPDFGALQKVALASGGRALQSKTARDIGPVMLDALFS
ncbi:substrate-binding and VWA domain-containing protein [Longispora urticae]